MSPHPPSDITAALRQALASEGVRGVLRFLNRRAPHRFTGVYRIDSPLLRSVYLFDRENPSLEVGADAPLRETYCSITGETEAPFSTSDARADSRVQAHPARDSTLSYCGVPLVDSAGAVVGTLCHFDLVPRPVPNAEVRVLQTAAPLVVSALRENGKLPAA